MSEITLNRREALGVAAGAVLAGCAVGSEPAQGPAPAAGPRAVAGAGAETARRGRRAPASELVHSMEFEEQAQLVLAPEVFARVAGSDREPFNRRTLHQQLGSPTLDMDLGVTILGETLFTPMIVAPIAQLGAYHAEGEVAMVRGAAEAYTGTIVSSRSSVPFERLVGLSPAPLWYSVYAEGGAREQAHAAAAAGAGAVFITVGTGGARPGVRGARAGIDWRAVDSIRQGLQVPIVIKGIATPAEANAALERGVQGIVVSNHGAPVPEDDAAPMDALVPIVEAVGGRVPILIDGSFRRGSDVLMALAHGAQGVLIGRPAAWALAAYGSDGVRVLFELMQHELARSFGMMGVATPAQLTRDHIRVHRWATG
jgi:4-hydroxymandelate oxidase